MLKLCRVNLQKNSRKISLAAMRIWTCHDDLQHQKRWWKSFNFIDEIYVLNVKFTVGAAQLPTSITSLPFTTTYLTVRVDPRKRPTPPLGCLVGLTKGVLLLRPTLASPQRSTAGEDDRIRSFWWSKDRKRVSVGEPADESLPFK